MSDLQQLLRTAVHEAGHATVGLVLFPNRIVYASIVPQDELLGAVGHTLEWEEIMAASIDEFIDHQAVVFAGRAAEEAGYNGDYRKSGLQNDETAAYEQFNAYWRSHREFEIDEVDIQNKALERARAILHREHQLFTAIMTRLLIVQSIGPEGLKLLRDKHLTTT